MKSLYLTITDQALEAMRKSMVKFGTAKVTSDEAKVVLAKKLHANKSLEIDDICRTLRISRSTFYRYVRL